MSPTSFDPLIQRLILALKGRNALDDLGCYHLDRIEQVLSVGEDRPECGGDLSRLGEDITGRFVVNKIIRPRMVCRRCEAIFQAPMPSRPIERGCPGPGLLAHVPVQYGFYIG